MADEPGFLSRWSRRKTALVQGTPATDPQLPSASESNSAPPATPSVSPSASVPLLSKTGSVQVQKLASHAQSAAGTLPSNVKDPSQTPVDSGPNADTAGVHAKLPVPSLADTLSLTKDSDFTPFMSREVSATVRNAAMKKLFADPHFNVMDGLDIYIDDYTKFEPLTEEVLRSMNGAKFLNLFEDEEKEVPAGDIALPAPAENLGIASESDPDLPAPADSPDQPVAAAKSGSVENLNNLTVQTVAQSYAKPDIANPANVAPETPSQPGLKSNPEASQPDHVHTDLRLQPNDAAPAPDAGRGAQ